MKFERTEVPKGMLINALYGMRNPKNSWDKSDTFVEDGDVKIGPNDLKLAQTLIKCGSDHSKFLRQIPVSVQITAPAYWWPEMDQYKVGTVTDSTSKMHKLLSKKIDKDCFEDKIEDTFLDSLECWRQWALTYQKSGDSKMERYYWDKLLAHLPHSWLQTRMWSANYAVLRNIYFARRHHKLNQWHEFCEWIESLPYAKELICYETKSQEDILRDKLFEANQKIEELTKTKIEPCKTYEDIIRREG